MALYIEPTLFALRCGIKMIHSPRLKRGGEVVGLVIGTAAVIGGGLWVYKRHRSAVQDLRDDRIKEALVNDPDMVGEVDALLSEGDADGKNRAIPHSKPGRQLYMNSVVAQVKNIMGTPVHNAANLKVARRIARDLMETHGVRPTHASKILPLIIEAVFVESAHEMEARTWGERVRSRRDSWGWWPRSPDPMC
jgi:hypothetical protein